MQEIKDKVVIFQNFICTKEKRLNFVKENTPKLAEIWGDYEVHINYNHTKNFDEISKLYKGVYPNLNLYNNLEKDWALVALAMAQEIDKPYIFNYAEDFECNMTKDDWENFVYEALIKRKVKYVNLTKIRKYTKDAPDAFPGYEEDKFGYYYDAKNSPPTRISGTGIYDREWLIHLLTEFIQNRDRYLDTIPYGYIELPNCLEGYLDYERGMRSYGDLKCGIPKKDLFLHWDEVTEQAEYVNKLTNQGKGNENYTEYWQR